MKAQLPPQRSSFRVFSVALTFLLLISITDSAIGQIRTSGLRSSGKLSTKKQRTKDGVSKKRPYKRSDDEDYIVPEKITVDPSASFTTQSIMESAAQLSSKRSVREMLMEKGIKPEAEVEEPNRQNLPNAPEALPLSQFPYVSKGGIGSRSFDRTKSTNLANVSPQVISLSFDGATGPTETGAFPPDTEGAVGPTQFLVFLNGRIRTFNKTTGTADGALNVDSDVFFTSVLTPPGSGEVSFTSDPNVRYDRLSGRWFLNILDVTLNSSTGAITKANRVLLAVSDGPIITNATVWTLYQFQGDATLFTDYESFGIDASAMYIGGDMFTLAGSFNSTKGFVIPKAPALAGSPLTVWSFSGLVATQTSAGPFAPRGVDNPDPANVGPTATGYFIGVDNASFGTLMIRRVTNPGSLVSAPTISTNISVATPLTTRSPVLVPHFGNTGGNNGRLDSLDDRLFAATIRNGRLWTAHNIGVDSSGVAGASNNRNAARWYELQNLGATPSVVQSGTLYDNSSPNNSTGRNYWIPSIMVSGQGHAALGCSIAGTNERVNAFTTGRLSGDSLGTMRDGPGGATLSGYTSSSFAYNPPSDTGGTSGRRWGDYSFTTLDPIDDMTMWTIQEYVNGTNTYGVRVAKLSAPAPPAIADGPNSGVYNVAAGSASTTVTITGNSVGGTGFYDPGSNLGGSSMPFSHVTASISGSNVTVNSITYNSPTSITLDLNTIGATLSDPTLSTQTLRDITITNPDGQSVTRTGIINVLQPTAAPADISGRITDQFGNGISRVYVRISAANGSFSGGVYTNSFGFYRFESLVTGVTYVIAPVHKKFEFSPLNVVYNHLDEVTGMNFTANSLSQ